MVLLLVVLLLVLLLGVLLLVGVLLLGVLLLVGVLLLEGVLLLGVLLLVGVLLLGVLLLVLLLGVLFLDLLLVLRRLLPAIAGPQRGVLIFPGVLHLPLPPGGSLLSRGPVLCRVLAALPVEYRWTRCSNYNCILAVKEKEREREGRRGRWCGGLALVPGVYSPRSQTSYWSWTLGGPPREAGPPPLGGVPSLLVGYTPHTTTGITLYTAIIFPHTIHSNNVAHRLS